MNSMLERLRKLLKDKGVKLAILFGSRAINKETTYSDFDIAILADDIDLEILICDIAKAINVPEDLIDVILINDDLPYELLFNIFREGVLLVGDQELFEELKIRYAEKYWDFKEFCRILELNKKYLEFLKRSE